MSLFKIKPNNRYRTRLGLRGESYGAIVFFMLGLTYQAHLYINWVLTAQLVHYVHKNLQLSTEIKLWTFRHDSKSIQMPP